jgi:hypothetical protein
LDLGSVLGAHLKYLATSCSSLRPFNTQACGPRWCWIS